MSANRIVSESLGRQCRRCEQVKPWSEFGKCGHNPSGSDRIHSWCYPCRRIYCATMARAKRAAKRDTQEATI